MKKLLWFILLCVCCVAESATINLTNHLILVRSPALDDEAASKRYVDLAAGGVVAGVLVVTNTGTPGQGVYFDAGDPSGIQTGYWGDVTSGDMTWLTWNSMYSNGIFYVFTKTNEWSVGATAGTNAEYQVVIIGTNYVGLYAFNQSNSVFQGWADLLNTQKMNYAEQQASNVWFETGLTNRYTKSESNGMTNGWETGSHTGFGTNGVNASLVAHVGDTIPHVSTGDRTNWDGVKSRVDVLYEQSLVVDIQLKSQSSLNPVWSDYFIYDGTVLTNNTPSAGTYGRGVNIDIYQDVRNSDYWTFSFWDGLDEYRWSNGRTDSPVGEYAPVADTFTPTGTATIGWFTNWVSAFEFVPATNAVRIAATNDAAIADAAQDLIMTNALKTAISTESWHVAVPIGVTYTLGTVTISRASGLYTKVTLTNNATITFSLASYDTNGYGECALTLQPNGFSTTFDPVSISTNFATNAISAANFLIPGSAALSISTNNANLLLFMKAPTWSQFGVIQ